MLILAFLSFIFRQKEADQRSDEHDELKEVERLRNIKDYERGIDYFHNLTSAKTEKGITLRGAGHSISSHKQAPEPTCCNPYEQGQWEQDPA